MKKPCTKRKKTKQSVSEQTPEASRDLKTLAVLLQSVLTHLLSEGVRKRQLTSVIDRATRSAMMADVKRSMSEEALGAVTKLLHAWHNEDRMLDKLAQPIPLPKTGSRSIRSLAAATLPTIDPDVLLEELARANVLRRVGRRKYVPISAMANISARGRQLDCYLGQTLLHFASTLSTNLGAHRSSRKLIERAAMVNDLPAARLKDFRRLSAEQGEVFVSTLNDWLESNRVPERRRRTTPLASAGVNVFAFAVPRR